MEKLVAIRSEPASSDGSGEPISPARSVERASSFANDPDREGGGEGKQRRRRGNRPPSCGSGEGTAVKLKQRRKKKNRRLSDPFPCMILDGSLVREESAVVPEEQRKVSDPSMAGISHRNCAVPLLHLLRRVNEEGGHQELAAILKEVVEQSDDTILKKGSLDDAELLMYQHSHSSSRIPANVQFLLDMDNGTLDRLNFYLFCNLTRDAPEDRYDWPEDKPERSTQLGQRLAFYRIRGYELSMGGKLAILDDENLAQHYPLHVLRDEGYFEHYEESLEWYFDPELCKNACFEDYQLLVLRSNGEYEDWDYYHSTRNSYEKDVAYVQYCEAIENETKWIEDCLMDNTIPWERVERVVQFQALLIALCFGNVSQNSAYCGFKDHVWSVLFDFDNYKESDGVYFEIWKRVAKQKVDFTEALSEVYQGKMFPLCTFDIEQELKGKCFPWSMKDKYDAYVACIPDSVPDDQALKLITEAVRKMDRKPKTYVDYARKKLEIAKEICLIKGEWQRSLCNAEETMA